MLVINELHLKSKVTNITRDIIVQDLAQAIDHAIPFDGVQAMVHDFFEEQPVKVMIFHEPLY